MISHRRERAEHSAWRAPAAFVYTRPLDQVKTVR